MKEFLRTVAEHYRKKLTNPDKTLNSLGLVDYLFVFPNRRSGLFFNQYLIEGIDVPIFAPNMTTISELFPRLDTKRHLRILDRIELLFQLYTVYKQVSRSSETFDSFMFWGEMIIGDFNDADKYLVDTKLLFKNLKELKEIEETFEGLEEEQIKIIRTFWKNFNPEKSSPSKDAFRQTWQGAAEDRAEKTRTTTTTVYQIQRKPSCKRCSIRWHVTAYDCRRTKGKFEKLNFSRRTHET